MTPKPKARKASRPIYFRVERLVRPDTGEEVGALVPRYKADQMEMRARRYSVGSDVRGELKKPRNPAFHRKAHALGQMAVDNIDGFEQLSAHDALKRLQREAGVQCEATQFEIAGFGTVEMRMPRSLAFDEMDEGDFTELWEGVIAWIRSKYWPTLDDYAIEQFALMAENEG